MPGVSHSPKSTVCADFTAARTISLPATASRALATEVMFMSCSRRMSSANRSRFAGVGLKTFADFTKPQCLHRFELRVRFQPGPEECDRRRSRSRKALGRDRAGCAGAQRCEVLRVHDCEQLARIRAIEMNLVTHAVAGCEIHRLEAHPTGFFQRDRPDAQPALASLHVDARRQEHSALALLAKGLLHRDNGVLHADGGADILMSQQQGHGRQAGLRPTKNLSGDSSGMVKPERTSGSRTVRIC